MTLDRNPTDYHTEIEQAAFEPNNLVPASGQPGQNAAGAGSSPTPMPTAIEWA